MLSISLSCRRCVSHRVSSIRFLITNPAIFLIKKYRFKLVNLANDPSTYLGKDKSGNEWNAQTEPDGTQTWVCYRDGIISDGGFYDPPLPWNEENGLIKD